MKTIGKLFKRKGQAETPAGNTRASQLPANPPPYTAVDGGNEGQSVDEEEPSAVLGMLINTLTLAEKVVEEIPFPGVKSAVSGLLELVEMFQVTGENAEAVKALVVRIERLQDNALKPLRSIPESQLDERSWAPLIGKIQGLVRGLDDALTKGERITTHGRLHRFATHKADKNTIEGLVTAMDELISDFKFYLSVDQAIDLKVMRVINEKAREDEEWKRLHLLPSANARHDGEARSKADECFEGTRVDVLKIINEWIENPAADTHKIFWLSGAAGIGKSTIAQTVAKSQDDQHRLAASFFFSSTGEADLSDPKLFFPTIAHQLARVDKIILNAMSETLKKDPDVIRSEMPKQMQDLIVGPLSAWKDDMDRPLVFVVDALDECSSVADAETMLHLWASKIKVLPPRFRLFVTSRPQWNIEKKFKSNVLMGAHDSIKLHDLEGSIVRGDIERYLRHHLALVAETHGLEDWPTEDQLDALFKKVGEFFIAAATAVKFMDSEDWSPNYQLEVYLGHRDESAASGANRTIDELYLQIVANVIPKGTSPEQEVRITSRFKTVVGSIICMKEALTAQQLDVFLNVEPGTVNIALNRLKAVILVPDARTQPLRIFHPSFPEFLADHQRCTDPRFLLDEPRANGALAEICFTHMNKSLDRNLLRLEARGKLLSEVGDLDSRLSSYISPALKYSCINFPSHISSSSTVKSSVLTTQVEAFCENKLLSWLELLSYLGKADTALSALEITRNFYLATDHPIDRVCALLHDSIRFVRRFYEAIERCPDLIHTSIVDMAPNSALREQYSHRQLEWFCQGREGRWPSTVRTHTVGSGPASVVAVHAKSAPYMAAISMHPEDEASVPVWDVRSGSLVASLPLDGLRPSLIDLRPDGRQIAVALYDGDINTVRLIDVITADSTELLRMSAADPRHFVIQMVFQRNGLRLVLGLGPDQSDFKMDKIEIWDCSARAPVQAIACTMNSFAPSQDDRFIACSAFPSSFSIWDVTTGECIQTFGKGDWMQDMRGDTPLQKEAFLPDGVHCIALTSWLGLQKICVYNYREGSRLHVLPHKPSEYYNLYADAKIAISVNGTIVCPIEDEWNNRSIVYFNHSASLDSDDDAWVIPRGDASITSLSFSSDGHTLAIGTDDGMVRILDVMESKTEAQNWNGEGMAMDMDAMVPISGRLAMQGTIHEASRPRDIYSGETECLINHESLFPRLIRWNWAGGESSSLRVTGIEDDINIYVDPSVFGGDVFRVSVLTVSPDEQFIAFWTRCYSTPNSLGLFRVEDRTSCRLWPTSPTSNDRNFGEAHYQDPVYEDPQFSFSDDGSFIYMARDGAVNVWAVPEGCLLRCYRHPVYRPRTCAFSTDMRKVLLIGRIKEVEPGDGDHDSSRSVERRDGKASLDGPSDGGDPWESGDNTVQPDAQMIPIARDLEWEAAAGDDEDVVMLVKDGEARPTPVQRATFVQFDLSTQTPRYLVWGDWLELVTTSFRIRLLWIPPEWKTMVRHESRWIGPCLTLQLGLSKVVRLDIEELFKAITSTW